jgi:phosphoserine phosphatase
LNSPATLKAARFIDSVLLLRPRLAVFDCDGTLWAGDAGEGFFDWELKHGVVSEEIVRWARPRYADYKAGRVDEDTMCGEMVSMHRGLMEADVQRAASRYFQENFVSQIFPEMRELVVHLSKTGCDVWVASSTNEWVIQAGMKHFGVPANRILAASVQIENRKITDRLIRVPSGDGKPKAIREAIGKNPDVAFGNSRWDAEMLQMSRHAIAVSPFPELENTAQERGWTIYWPDGSGRK